MERTEHTFVAMGGPCRLRIDSGDKVLVAQAVTAAVTEVERLEAKYSRYREGSLLSIINRAAGKSDYTPVDPETAGLLDYADTLWRESNGLFDLTSGILRQAWDFKSGQLPHPSELEPLLNHVGWEKVLRRDDSISLPYTGMELDFGGCVKEYTCDSAAAVLRRHGIQHALVDLAGDIAAVGAQGDGRPWRIGIRHPAARTKALATIELEDAALASSGDYERCIEIDGKRYGHILNPRTGWPVHGLVAASVVAPQCLVAGSGATVALLKPAEEGIAWLEQLGLGWLAIDRNMQCHGCLASQPASPALYD